MNTGPARLGKWLDLTLANRGIKSRELATKIDVHESAVHNWRKGKNVPQLSTLQRLAALLGVDPIRLAVTAGLLDPTLVQAEPLPTPEPIAQRRRAQKRADELLTELASLAQDIRTADEDANARTLEALSKLRTLISGEELKES